MIEQMITSSVLIAAVCMMRLILDGRVEELYMGESRSTLETARLHFALSDSRSNATDMDFSRMAEDLQR